MQNQELLQRLNNILINLMYLLGEKVAWLAEKIEILKEMMHSFMEGYVNGTVAYLR